MLDCMKGPIPVVGCKSNWDNDKQRERTKRLIALRKNGPESDPEFYEVLKMVHDGRKKNNGNVHK